MGFLQGILGEVTSLLGGAAPGAPQGLAASVLDMIRNGQPGGLGGLVQTFKDRGLGDIVSSWVSTGQNLPISPEQIQQVLGDQRVQEFAQQHGIDTQQVSTQLAQILPVLVDKLTPNGTVPNAQ